MNQIVGEIWLLIVPPLLFLLKDVIATTAILSTEPGITANAVHYYAIALLPGTLLVSTGNAFLINVLFGALIGAILFIVVIARTTFTKQNRNS
jgi:hypothetical protein